MSGSDSIGDAIVAGSAAGELEDAIRASKRKRKKRHSAFASPTADDICSNCETKLTGPVCHSCGQTADGFHRPVWELFAEVFDGLFGVEGRLWRTVPPLMFQPGKLTLKYLSGARARYVLPFRLYLTASVLFFLMFSGISNLGAPPVEDVIAAEELEATRESMQEGIDGLEESLAGVPGMAPERIEEIQRRSEASIPALDEIEALNENPELREARQQAWREETKLGIRMALLPEEYPEEVRDEILRDENRVGLSEETSLTFEDVESIPLSIRRTLADQADKIIDDNGEAMREEMERWAPRLMFGLLPIYAILLAFTHFYKRGYYLYDHLVVTLHFHAFIFFCFILLMLLGPVFGGWGFLIFVLWSNYYLYRIHRVVYSHGRFSSMLRTIFMVFVHAIILSIAMLVLVIVGAMAA